MKLKEKLPGKGAFREPIKNNRPHELFILSNMDVVIIVLSWRRGDHFICVK